MYFHSSKRHIHSAIPCHFITRYYVHIKTGLHKQVKLPLYTLVGGGLCSKQPFKGILIIQVKYRWLKGDKVFAQQQVIKHKGKVYKLFPVYAKLISIVGVPV